MNNNVEQIVTELINYNNKDNLSWLQVLNVILKKLNITYNDKILNEVIHEIAKKGYDIIPNPFKLEKYR